MIEKSCNIFVAGFLFYGKIPIGFLYNKLIIMEINKILSADYLDLVFDNRNKNYGSYELRKRYNSRASKALLITVAIVSSAVIVPAAFGKIFHSKTELASLPILDADKIIELSDIKPPIAPPIIKPPEVKPPSTANANVAKTINNAPPVIVENTIPKPIVKPPTIDELKDAKAGPVTNPGNGGTETATSSKVPTGKPGDGTAESEGTGKVTVTAPVTIADEWPEYPGGLEALRKYLQANLRYPAEARAEGIQGRVTIRFVVNSQGQIEGAEVQRGLGYGCDKEALRVVNAMKPWKPGKVNGKAVKVYYTLPITFKLE